jgi:hypothetical protein
MQFGAFVHGRLWRHKRAGLVAGVFEGAVKPQAELPAELERGQRSRVVALQRMVGGVANHADLVEDLLDLFGQNALAMQAANQLVLAFFGQGVEAGARRQRLGQPLGKLAQLEQAGVGVFGKVALRQRTQAP